ncbi:MAG: NAD(P)-dependent oxidoreductase [Hyphomicrobiaceae bacterium]
MDKSRPIVVTGAAGLIGQNLIPRLKSAGYTRIIGIDKHPANVKTLARLHPDVLVIEADLAMPGDWDESFAGAATLVLNHAQIGGIDESPFIANNITATENVLAAAKRHGIPHMVHISSSVVNSMARDFYTESKKAQEQLAVASGIPCSVLRPTLMFGWFDRKHVGWLARFMKRTPVFPVPGDGRYLRQPLYAGDFCQVIAACIANPRPGENFNITGQSKIDYIDLIKAVRTATGATTRILHIPYAAFWLLLKVYAVADRNPPFTTTQLKALVTPDVFEVIDWPSIFAVTPTSLDCALHETFQNPSYSSIVLEF